MSFDLAQMSRLTAAHGPVVRVVVAEVAGSAPREVMSRRAAAFRRIRR